jgi:hypothetical protein
VIPAVVERAAADRQLVVGATMVIFLARLAEVSGAWLVAVLMGLGVLVGVGWNRMTATPGAGAGGTTPSFRLRWESVVSGAAGIESGIVPAVLAASLALGLRLVPIDWRFIAALAGAYLLLGFAIALERRLARSVTDDADRWKAVFVSLATAFVGFTAVASTVGGGIAGLGAPPLDERGVVLLASGDAVVAALLGFRLVRLGPARRREALISGAGFGAVMAIGAGLLRAMAVPQLVGPALLTLLFYLWDALNATAPSIRRDPRWRWQVALLIVLATVVIGWNLRLRA